MRYLGKLISDERGASLITLTLAIVALFAFAMLAIDVGTIALVKTQLQNAADAGGLAASVSLALSRDTTLAVNRAIQLAEMNKALIAGDPEPFNVMGDVVITAADVTFPEDRLIKVTTHRTIATGDPLKTYFLRTVDITGGLTEMTAVAAARTFWVCGSDCLKPWAPPDRWFDADSSDSWNPDSITNPLEYYDPILTGYTEADLGLPITLKLGNGNKRDFGMGWYYAIDFPPLNKDRPITGGDQYREWIAGCADAGVIVEPGDSVQVEPGNMVGPTGQGLTELIAMDRDAQWDMATGEVLNSAFEISPRLIKAALFDPSLGVRDDAIGRKYVVIVKILVLFIEEEGPGGEVTGRFVRMNSPGGVICDDQTIPTFLYKSALVQ
jgi:hypothetical protein